MINDNEITVLFPNGVDPTWQEVLDDVNTVTQVYYKDNKPYGVVAMTPVHDMLTLVNSGTVLNQPFTVGMRRAIYRQGLKTDLALSSSMKDSSITRYGVYDEATQSFYIRRGGK